jgi:hypothetical protein
VVWLSGLFNPQSFLTAVMQTTARRNDWPLDKTVLLTEVTKKTPEQVEAPSRCALPACVCVCVCVCVRWWCGAGGPRGKTPTPRMRDCALLSCRGRDSRRCRRRTAAPPPPPSHVRTP